MAQHIWFPDLVKIGTMHTAADTNGAGAPWSSLWSLTTAGANVLTTTAREIQPRALRIDTSLTPKPTADDRALVKLVVRAMKRRTVVITTTALATRLEQLLGRQIVQHQVSGSAPVSILWASRRRPLIGAVLRGELGDLNQLLARFHDEPSEKACVGVDEQFPPRATEKGLRVQRVQAQWPLLEDGDDDAPVLELVGELLLRGKEVVPGAAGARTWAILRLRAPQGFASRFRAVNCELPFHLVEATLRRLIEVAGTPEMATRQPLLADDQRPRPQHDDPLLWRVLARQLGRTADTPGPDAWWEVLRAVSPLRALLDLPIDVLWSTLRRQCATASAAAVSDELLAKVPPSTAVAALTLGEGFTLSARGDDVVVAGHGCEAVFAPDGRLRGGGFAAGVTVPLGISDAELRRWADLDRDGLELIDDGAVNEPSGAFLQVAELIDSALAWHVVLHNVVWHVKVRLQDVDVLEGTRPLVVVSGIADPRRPTHADPDAVVLMRALRAAGHRVVYDDERVTFADGFGARSEADGPSHAVVAYGDPAPAGAPTAEDVPGFVHRVDAHRKLVRSTLTSSVQLVLAWLLRLAVVRCVRPDPEHGEGVLTDAAYARTGQKVWPLRNGRVLVGE